MRWFVHPPLTQVDGAPYSTLFRAPFHRGDCARSHSDSCFVQGAGLLERWRQQPAYTVIELGFGLGVNFLATLSAWQNDPQRSARLEYVAIERHPLSRADLRRGLAMLGEIDETAALLDQWPALSHGTHRLTFASGKVTLLLVVDDAPRCLPGLRAAADSIFLSDFGPQSNPCLWQPSLFKGLARLARHGATLISSSRERIVADGLRVNGFNLIDAQAPMSAAARGTAPPLRAVYAPRWHTFAAPAARPTWAQRSAVVVGAGLAGCAVARALSLRGWQVQVIDRASSVASAASSQPMCAEHLHVSADDNLLAQLTRAAHGLSRSGHWWPEDDAARHQTGKLQLATTDRGAAQQRLTIAKADLPNDYVQALDRDRALAQAKWPWLRTSYALAGAIWFPGARSGCPLELCRYWLHGGLHGGLHSGLHGAIDLRLRQAICRLSQTDAGWQLYDDEERLVATADIVVLANADGAPRLAPLNSMALRQVAGQTSVIRSAIGVPHAALGGGSYLCPIDEQRFLIGATFEPPEEFETKAAGDASNLAGLARTVGTLPPSDQLVVISRHGGTRCATRDRLPAIGAWPDEARARQHSAAMQANARMPMPRLPGLYGSFAHGARGLLWSVLAAEILVAHIEGDAIPASGELLEAVDPARYVRRWLRETSDN